MEPSQVLEISRTATAFTAVCEICVGFTASTFAGRLDVDLDEGVFLCRRGHQVTVVRAPAGAETAQTGERTAA